MPIDPNTLKNGDTVSSSLDLTSNFKLLKLINSRQWLVEYPDGRQQGVLVAYMQPALTDSQIQQERMRQAYAPFLKKK